MQRINSKIFALSLLLVCVLMIVCFTGCSPDGETTFAEPADYVDSRLVEANTAFAINIFEALREEKPGENIFISPASISLALAMTYNGADGETAEVMRETLQFGDMDKEDINKAFYDLLTILQNPDPEVELSVANSLWAREDVSFYDSFMENNREYYRAKLSELDFDRPDAADTINKWVEQETNNRIKDIIEPPIDSQTILFLINAIYFNADWTEPFDPELTREIPFHLQTGEKKNHPVMFREGDYQYLDGDGFQAVCIPYGETERLGMYVFLPDQDLGLEDFYGRLTPEAWDTWMGSFRETEGSVGLPRFKYEYEATLNDALKSLGMEKAFLPHKADFPRMRPIPPNVYIEEVKHKSFVEVNEEGTEAAAATSVEMALESVQTDRFSMTVDRPFFYSIVDNKTGSVLFAGSVYEPLQ